MKRRIAILTIVVTFVLVAAGLGLFHVVRDRVKRRTWMNSDVWQIASILLVFVEDNGRMPKGWEELCDREYIEKRGDGRFYPGPGVIHRHTYLDMAAWDRPFFYPDRVFVNYQGPFDQVQIIQVTVDGYGEAQYSARVLSGYLKDFIKTVEIARRSTMPTNQ